MLYLPVAFLLDSHVWGFAAGTYEGLRLLEEKNRPATSFTGELVNEDVAVGQVYLDQLLTVLTKAGKEPDSLIVFSHSPAYAAALVATGIAFKDAVFTHLEDQALLS
ncbi:MAG: hypothetical protein ACYC6O_06655 [Thermoleophilia bacterium]